MDDADRSTRGLFAQDRLWAAVGAEIVITDRAVRDF
jgi:hypothetical protein